MGYRGQLIRWVVRRERDGLLLPKPRREEDLLPLPAPGNVHVAIHGLDSEGGERRAEGTITVQQWEEITRLLR